MILFHNDISFELLLLRQRRAEKGRDNTKHKQD